VRATGLKGLLQRGLYGAQEDAGVSQFGKVAPIAVVTQSVSVVIRQGIVRRIHDH